MYRKLLDYLPLFMQEYREIIAIMQTGQEDIDETTNAIENIINDQFISDATENGVKRWETILKITAKETYTLEERKFNILARLNEQISIENALETLCGKGGYALRVYPNNYEIIVRLSLSNENNIEAVNTLLSKMIPCNMIKTVILYNTNTYLTAFTHSQLASYTHNIVANDNL